MARVEYERDLVLEALIKTCRISESQTWRRDLVELSIVLSSLAPSPPLLRI